MKFTGWRKSTRSGNQGNCVLVAHSDDGQLVGVRDSKDDREVTLVFSSRAWQAFIDALKQGKL